jgi:hypothetical protein
VVGGLVSDQAVAGAAPARPPRRFWKRFLLAVGIVVFAAVGWFIYSFGPRNVIGMLRYDQRQEGRLKLGDRAPDVDLLALDGATPVHLRDSVGGKPLVLVFGSYT